MNLNDKEIFLTNEKTDAYTLYYVFIYSTSWDLFSWQENRFFIFSRQLP